ncbi:putative uncharacterized protein [Parachlamydia acanthamoebae UV-7]|uniref:Uncharacterized protein n=2 Tax=Parachlamydia acanthamoebae TaxID=83552 RepID=F8KWP8_PARAV|nr:hypothetical protein [Parachlamydia acanthamoebae]EFB41039.1 hypothetical protein pah_c056o005 [Parachlamydia acanthamoebae str. Hall's coccus]KIA76082.1 hypothetical protein DB43_AX00040 [Parachlamydia acanthamoebae]CCB85462.1 putative uncharacterized protein [Parachlamydia acanthamoebae UV-7]
MATSGQDLGFTSPNDPGFNGLTFLENLQNILFKSVPPTNTSQPAYQGMNAESTAAGKTLDSFFAQYSSGNHLPTTWADFINAFRTYNGGTNPGTTSGDAFTGFYNEYASYIGYSTGDWSSLSSVTQANIQTQFQNAFTNFINKYTYQTDGTVGSALNFMTQWHNYLTGTAALNTASSGTADLATYEQIYKAFFPNGDFASRLQSFYQDVLKFTGTDANGTNGYFIPSQQLYNWFQQIQQEYSRSTSGASGPLTPSVETSSSKKVLILDRIFALLIEMIDTLQKVASSQADRLSFLTQWQKAYTDSMNQVPTFIQGGGVSAVNQSTTSGRNARDDLNNLNSNLTETMRSNRSVISDDSKSLQTNVNQSNDAVTQQSDLTTSLIQEFSTILAAIYR